MKELSNDTAGRIGAVSLSNHSKMEYEVMVDLANKAMYQVITITKMDMSFMMKKHDSSNAHSQNAPTVLIAFYITILLINGHSV